MTVNRIRRERVTIEQDWYEPYNISLAIKAGGLVYVSGQVGIEADGTTVGNGDFEVQARKAFANLETVLIEAGSTLGEVVKVTIFLTDMANLETVVQLRAEYFSKPYPADTLIEVSSLAQPDWQIEIDAIAVAE
ncbi:MAG: RidA family protein [Microbacteriaceae bacterium]|nr:MAG: RidA family protein [Microbacteriaceae bacterium]